MKFENIFRTIGYLLLLILTGFLYYFLHSHFLFIVLVMMILAPFLSVAMCFYMKHRINATVVDGSRDCGVKGEEAFFTMHIDNPTWFMTLDSKVTLIVKNTFFKTSAKQVVSVPIYPKKGFELTLPIIPTLPGVISIEIEKLSIKDLMGFCFLEKKINSSCEKVILPKESDEQNIDKPGLEQGMLESEESTKKGNDFSDVQEIREYIPGDKLMSIHWKLSAKRDILMVKDRVSMSDKQLVVLPELCHTNFAVLEGIVTATYSVINSMISDKTTVRLMYWSAKRFEYEDIRIDNKEELIMAFSRMFYEETYDGMDEAAVNMQTVHPEMRAFIHIAGDEKGIAINVRENS